MAASEVIGNVGNMALNIFILVIGVLFFVGLALVTWYTLDRYKKYSQFKCIIWGRDGFGQITETVDAAGIFVDKKTINKRFFLRKANVGLDPDNVPYIICGKRKIVYLLKTGLKNFRYIKPVVGESFNLSVGEEDVNWAVNSYERQKKTFGTNLLLQYLPFISLGFVSIIILIMFIYFFKQFPVLKETAVALKEAAAAFAQSQSGTVVLT